MVVIAGDQREIVHGQSVMSSDEVDRAAGRFGEQVGTAFDAPHDRRDLAWLAAHEAAHVVAKPIVPLQPRWRPFADLVLGKVPWFGDQTYATPRSPLRDLLDQASPITRQQRGEVESEAVDSEIRKSVQRSEDEPTDVGIGDIRDVARAAVVVVRAI